MTLVWKSKAVALPLTWFDRDSERARIVKKVSHLVGAELLCFQRVTGKIKWDSVPLHLAGRKGTDRDLIGDYPSEIAIDGG